MNVCITLVSLYFRNVAIFILNNIFNLKGSYVLRTLNNCFERDGHTYNIHTYTGIIIIIIIIIIWAAV